MKQREIERKIIEIITPFIEQEMAQESRTRSVKKLAFGAIMRCFDSRFQKYCEIEKRR